MPANSTLSIRKGSSAEWLGANPVLANGELGYDTTNKILKIGDGVNSWADLNNHYHSASNISDFNSAVSGLLPVTNILAGSNVTVAQSGTTFTISTDSGGPSAIKEYELITTNKTTFTVTGGYELNNLDVYHNGIRLLSGSDYTATDSATFSLAQPAVSGDVVEWMGYSAVPRHQLILGEVRSDTIGNINYLGRAVAGSSEANNVWTIKRYTIADNGTDISTATASNVAWNNRLTSSYV